MRRFAFETVDVFTERQFGGNPLAVFTDARGLGDGEMQALAAEFNLAETTFVLPPEDPANTARIRIFNRTAEMPFAGHPSVGTAYVLARRGRHDGGVLRLEAPAGLIRVAMETDEAGRFVGGEVEAPQPLSVGGEVAPELIAACLGLDQAEVLTAAHPPSIVSVGVKFVLAELTREALDRCVPDVSAFRRAVALTPSVEGRFSLHVYARDDDPELLHARMFAPLDAMPEDPATGSANAPLAALLLSLGEAATARFTVRQGERMGRPSLLRLTARRAEDGLRATIAGRCRPVLAGEATLDAVG